VLLRDTIRLSSLLGRKNCPVENKSVSVDRTVKTIFFFFFCLIFKKAMYQQVINYDGKNNVVGY
jgi:hypothetical protein